MKCVFGYVVTLSLAEVESVQVVAEVAQLAEIGIALHGKAAGEGDALGIGFLPGLELVHAFGGLGHA